LPRDNAPDSISESIALQRLALLGIECDSSECKTHALNLWVALLLPLLDDGIDEQHIQQVLHSKIYESDNEDLGELLIRTTLFAILHSPSDWAVVDKALQLLQIICMTGMCRHVATACTMMCCAVLFATCIFDSDVPTCLPTSGCKHSMELLAESGTPILLQLLEPDNGNRSGLMSMADVARTKIISSIGQASEMLHLTWMPLLVDALKEKKDAIMPLAPSMQQVPLPSTTFTPPPTALSITYRACAILCQLTTKGSRANVLFQFDAFSHLGRLIARLQSRKTPHMETICMASETIISLAANGTCHCVRFTACVHACCHGCC
jgi:hypothetical protein